MYLIKRPGVYFISKSVKGAFKRDGRLFEMGVYWSCLLQTLAQQQLLTRGAWAATGYSSRLVCLFVCL